MMTRPTDITGQKFDRLTAIRDVGGNRHGRRIWLCECSCGNVHTATINDLRRGHTRSCGCLQQEYRRKHGDSRTRLFSIYHDMKSRCLNPSNTAYKHYGGRGITVCTEWLQSFAVFRDWSLSHGYAAHLTIDRKDNNGNYTPANCCWATRKEQARHTRYTRAVIRSDGVYFPTIIEAAEATGLRSGTPISGACRGRRETAGGYGWRYAEVSDFPITKRKQKS